MNGLNENNNLLIYKNKQGNIPAISKHLNNIFSDEELEERVVVSKMENTTTTNSNW
ncbi:MAG: hypothetical protein RSA48_01810 [Bacilli bacterium]